MKSKIFSISIVILILAAAFVIAGKFGIFGDWSFSSKGKILPIKEWKKVLPGEWKLKRKYVHETEAWIEEADVVYKADGTFNVFTTIKIYTSSYPESEWSLKSKANLFAISGGSIEGKWSIKESEAAWFDDINFCGLSDLDPLPGKEVNSNYDICGDYKKDARNCFGDCIGAKGKSSIKKFTRDKIIIEGKDYSKDERISIVFTREQ